MSHLYSVTPPRGEIVGCAVTKYYPLYVYTSNVAVVRHFERDRNTITIMCSEPESYTFDPYIDREKEIVDNRC